MIDMVAWIQAVINEVSPNGQYQRGELHHGTGDGSPERLETIELRFDDGSVVDAEKLAAHIQSVAQQDADTHAAVGNGLVQRYVLAAFYPDVELPGTTYPFAVRGMEPQRSVSEAMTGSEPPTDRGERSQLMRVNDNLLRMVMTMWESGPGLLMRQNVELARRLEASEQLKVDNWLLTQSMLDRQQDRIAEAARTEQDLRRKADMWALIRGYAPALVAGLPTASKAHVVGQGFVEFSKAITVEEANAIAAALSAERRQELATVLHIAAEEAQREAEAKPDVSVPTAEIPAKKGRAK